MKCVPLSISLVKKVPESVVDPNRATTAVFDCFLFFDEYDMLEMRMNILWEFVSFFVIVESNRTFRGDTKGFADFTDSRFDKYRSKILLWSVKADEYTGPWGENYVDLLRASTKEALFHFGVKDGDVVILGDVDEIPNLEKFYRGPTQLMPASLQMTHYNYYWNCKVYDNGWTSPKMFRFGMFKNEPFSDIRRRLDFTIIPNMGWHFSFMGGAEKILQKVKTGGDPSSVLSYQKFADIDYIKRCMEEPKDFYGRGYRLGFVKFDSTFPKYMIENIDKYKDQMKAFMDSRRVLLIGPITSYNNKERNWSSPPLGVHRLAAYLRSKGHIVEVWDSNIHDNLDRKLSDGWDIIGFSTMQNTLHNDIKAMWRAEELCPNALLLAGGVEATLNYQDIFDNSPVTAVVLAEGEEQLLALANGVPVDVIPGMIVKKYASSITDDKLWDYWNAVDFDTMNYQAYWNQMKAKHPKDYDERGGDTVRLITSSHCNRNCTFCSCTQWHKFACGNVVKPAFLSAERMWKLVSKVKMQLPSVKSIYFCEDDVLQDRQRMWDFFTTIKEKGPYLKFLLQCHTSHLFNSDGNVDIELLDHMTSGGVVHMSLGVESCCSHCLESFHKPQKLDKLPDLINECVSRGITPHILIIMFPASTTRKCLQLNYDTLTAWLNLGATVSVEPNLISYRGAPLYTSLHEQEYRVREIDATHRLRYPYRILPDDLEARAIQEKFNARQQAFIDGKNIEHAFKGETGKYLVELLGEVLKVRK